MDLLDNFSEIVQETPVEQIISQIRDMISSGLLMPGDKLPSERILSDKLGVSRAQLRDALRKMEFYGILETKPQSGTIVSGLGIPALQGLMTDMLKLRGNDFKSLVESRVILERNIAQLAASNRTEDDLKAIRESLEFHEAALKGGKDGIAEDFLFHLKIADASHNSVLKSLMMIITPDTVQYFKKHNICAGGNADQIISEHRELYHAIEQRDSELAGELLSKHLQDVIAYVQTLKENSLNGSLTF